MPLHAFFWVVYISGLIAAFLVPPARCTKALKGLLPPAYTPSPPRPRGYQRTLPPARTPAHQLADACGGKPWEGATLMQVVTAAEAAEAPSWQCGCYNWWNGTKEKCYYCKKERPKPPNLENIFTLPHCKGPEPPKETVSIGRTPMPPPPDVARPNPSRPIETWCPGHRQHDCTYDPDAGDLHP